MPSDNAHDRLFDDDKRAVYDRTMEARLTRVEALLPTLATKEDLAREIGGVRVEVGSLRAEVVNLRAHVEKLDGQVAHLTNRIEGLELEVAKMREGFQKDLRAQTWRIFVLFSSLVVSFGMALVMATFHIATHT